MGLREKKNIQGGYYAWKKNSICFRRLYMEEITREEWCRRRGLRMKDGSTHIHMEGTACEGNYSMITLQTNSTHGRDQLHLQTKGSARMVLKMWKEHT